MEIHTSFISFVVFAAIFEAFESSPQPNQEVDLGKWCKYKTKQGYWYDELIHIDKFRNQLSNDEDFINLTIWAKAEKDVHIMLSSEEKPQWNRTSKPVYEIVIGSDRNHKCSVRSRLRDPQGTDKDLPALLSPVQYRQFTVRLMRNGTLSLYNARMPTPLISHTFSFQLNIQWIGFYCWDVAVAKVYYDCTPSDETRYRLWRDVFEGKSLTDLVTLPINVVNKFKARDMSNIQKQRTIDSSDLIVATWRYRDIKWDPKDYNNITVYDYAWAPRKNWNIKLSITGYELELPLRSITHKGIAYADLEVPGLGTSSHQ